MAADSTSPKSPKSPIYADYLACRDKVGRIGHLTRLREQQQFLPLSLADDLLCLDLQADEKLAILESAGSLDGRALEHFLTKGLETWSQDLAATAVRLWSQRTDHLLWFRILQTCHSPHVSQRVFYTVLDHAFRAGGSRIVRTAIQAEGLEGMSPAFHGLLLHRAVQWGEADTRLETLAGRVLTDLTRQLHPENKATPSAVAYLARFHPDTLASLASDATLCEPWRDQIRAILDQASRRDEQIARLDKLASGNGRSKGKGKADAKALDQVTTAWLPVWSRHALPVETVARLLTCSAAALHTTETLAGFDLFSGIGETTLTAALALIQDDQAFANAVTATFGFFAVPAATEFVTLLKTKVAASQDPGALLTGLPLRLRLELTESAEAPASGKGTVFALVKQEEVATLKGTPGKRVELLDDGEAEDATLPARRHFFDVAYRQGAVAVAGTKASTTKDQDKAPFWHLLLDAWTTPTEAKIASMAQAARQSEGVFRLCYIATLGRFRGNDQAALKLLDFIRSKEEDDVRAVIHALGGIGTPRAALELVAILTRPNMTAALQLEAATVLGRQDLAHLQNELRSAMKDLSASDGTESGAEVREAIASLIAPTAGQQPKPATAASPITDQQLDQALIGKIRHFKELSSEVKRALRTSQFFHMQVTADSAPETIDLSPVIDMQYKALELLFRETFEEACSRLINQGTLQRRLDVLGYARPIPRSMDEFEAYVASLPIVREIPFFSKFKLRKMLRAICQFRPGKRFTLDGLKAFALFFLCFSRQECRYGLAGLFPLGFTEDRDLYEYCKALHILQDFRNRAAHEGFHPDASHDIDGIWRQTADIVQTMFKTKHFLEDSARLEFAPKNLSTPIIEKKVS